MKASNGLWHLAVSVMVCSFIGSVKSRQFCPLPNFPADGNYLNKSKNFLPGDKVVYSCNEGFMLSGKEIRICMSNGAWSDHTPFCDQQVKLKNPRASNDFWPTLHRTIDSNTNTCFPWAKNTGESFQVDFDGEPGVVHAVKLFLEKGYPRIQISSCLGKTVIVCNEFHRFLERSQWVIIKCRNTTGLANSIMINNKADKSSNVTICEIQIYLKAEYGCKQPPVMRIANGFFEVNRYKANLQCEEGFSAVNSRLVCESNSWKGFELGPLCKENLCDPIVSNSSLDIEPDWKFLDKVRKISRGTRRQLKCKPGYRIEGSPDKVECGPDGMWTKTNATCIEVKSKTSTRTIVMITVGTVVVLIILLLLGVVIHLIKKQRGREVIVILKSPTDGSMTPGTESEYTTAYYETIQSVAAISPTSPRPSPLPPVLTDGHILSEDCKKTLKGQKLTPADIAFSTLKQSELYSK